MAQNNALIKQLNKEIDLCLKHGEYDKAEALCKRLCLAQGLVPADHMPENFPAQVKRKEHETMHRKKTSKRISGACAAAAVAVLLIGGTVSAAAIYNNDIRFTINGLFAGETDENLMISFPGEDGNRTELTAPELSGEDVVTPLSQEKGSASTPWLEKKVWDDTYEVLDSDDGVNWTKGYQTTRITQYRYADYFSAADDAGFERLFKENYNGDVFYHENEHLPDESDLAAGIGSSTDYDITGEFSCGKGHFTLEQIKDGNAAEAEDTDAERSAFMVITTTEETAGEREYLSASGISFKLTDDTATQTGETKTTTLLSGKGCHTVFTFTGMTEEEIHSVLDNVTAY